MIKYSHNPHKSLIGKHLEALSKYLYLFSSKFKNAINFVDFNAGFLGEVYEIFL